MERRGVAAFREHAIGNVFADFECRNPSSLAGKRSDLILLTGRECAIAAKLRLDNALGDQATVQRELVRLRSGSQGDEVKRLQAKLAIAPTGYFGPATKAALVRHQRANGIPSDGIYSPQLDERLSWGVFLN